MAYTASNFGLKKVELLAVYNASGYLFEVDYTNLKIKAYRSAGFTPAGSIEQHVHHIWWKTRGAAIAAGEAMSNTGIAGFTAAQGATGPGMISTHNADVTVAGGGATGGIGTNASAQTFTGTAVAAAALTEVANAVDLSSVSFKWMAIGY